MTDFYQQHIDGLRAQIEVRDRQISQLQCAVDLVLEMRRDRMIGCELLMELRKELELVHQIKRKLEEHDRVQHIAEVLEECQSRMEAILVELEQECRGLDLPAGKE